MGAFRRDTVALLGADELVTRSCKAPMSGALESLVFGIVTDSLDRPIANATATAAWQPVIKEASGLMTALDPISHEVTTDDSGRWRVCGVLRERAVSIGSLRSALIEIRIPADRLLYSRDLRVVAR